MSKFDLLYAGEDHFYYYDKAGNFVIEFERGKRPKGNEPIGRILTLKQARTFFEDQLTIDGRNSRRLTRNGFIVLAGGVPDR